MDSFWPLGPNPPAYLPELSVSVRSSANPGVHRRAPEFLILTPSYVPWMLPSPLPLRRQALVGMCASSLLFQSQSPGLKSSLP